MHVHVWVGVYVEGRGQHHAVSQVLSKFFFFFFPMCVYLWCTNVSVHVFACVWVHTHMICQESFPIVILPCAVLQGLSNPELTNND